MSDIAMQPVQSFFDAILNIILSLLMAILRLFFGDQAVISGTT